MIENYVVTYKDDDVNVRCAIMTGNQLASLYGFSDCTGFEVLHVYRTMEDGHLYDCPFHGSWKAPLNRLIVNHGLYDTVEYEWPEH